MFLQYLFLTNLMTPKYQKKNKKKEEKNKLSDRWLKEISKYLKQNRTATAKKAFSIIKPPVSY